MKNPAITVIIPLYNGSEFIEYALESVLVQTMPPEKIIVVDDGSTDDGPEIVDRMAQRHDITLLRKPNGGQSSARNFGVAHSDTPLFALLDQDDLWYPHHLEELVKPFREQRYPELGWVYSNLDEIDRSGLMVTRCCLDQLPLVRHPKRSLADCLETDMFILPSSSLITRRAFDAVGGFDERLVGYEDDDLFLRMFRQGFDNVYLKDALTKWRIFSASTSFTPRMARSRMIYFRKLIETFSDEPQTRRYVRALLAPRFFKSIVRDDYYRSLQIADHARLTQARADLTFILPYLKVSARLPMRVLFHLTYVMRIPSFRRAALRASPLARTLFSFISR
jgi:glycosyltransferase involved in cell wall biosynthesis